MSRPSWYRENLISLKQETFSVLQKSNFLWFCNGKHSILKYKIFLLIGLWVIIKMLMHFLADFCPLQSVTQFSSAKTQHLGEHLWQITPLSPDSWWLCRRQHSHTPQHVCHKCISNQNWSLQWETQETLSYREIMVTMRSRFLWVRHTLITWLPMAQDTNRCFVCHFLLTKPSTKVYYVNTESSSLEWLSPITIVLLQNSHFQCSKDEWEYIW